MKTDLEIFLSNLDEVKDRVCINCVYCEKIIIERGIIWPLVNCGYKAQQKEMPSNFCKEFLRPY